MAGGPQVLLLMILKVLKARGHRHSFEWRFERYRRNFRARTPAILPWREAGRIQYPNVFCTRVLAIIRDSRLFREVYWSFPCPRESCYPFGIASRRLGTANGILCSGYIARNDGYIFDLPRQACGGSSSPPRKWFSTEREFNMRVIS